MSYRRHITPALRRRLKQEADDIARFCSVDLGLSDATPEHGGSPDDAEARAGDSAESKSESPEFYGK